MSRALAKEHQLTGHMASWIRIHSITTRTSCLCYMIALKRGIARKRTTRSLLRASQRKQVSKSNLNSNFRYSGNILAKHISNHMRCDTIVTALASSCYRSTMEQGQTCRGECDVGTYIRSLTGTSGADTARGSTGMSALPRSCCEPSTASSS